MQAYLCGNCRHELIEGAVFCAHCESFFDVPVPDGVAPVGAAGVLMPSMVPFGSCRRMQKKMANALVAALIVCFPLVMVVKPADSVTSVATSDPGQPSIHEALDADLAADASDSYVSRRYATDVMLSMSTQCCIEHSSYSRRSGDQVIMLASKPFSVKQARNRALFAGYLLRDLRATYYATRPEQTVRVLLVDELGDRFAATIGPDRSHLPETTITMHAQRA